jgi:hypothetical protein
MLGERERERETDREPWLISDLMYKIVIYFHIIYLLKSSTCFQHCPAHLQEVYVAIVCVCVCVYIYIYIYIYIYKRIFVHRVGDQPRLYCDARSTNHQETETERKKERELMAVSKEKNFTERLV